MSYETLPQNAKYNSLSKGGRIKVCDLRRQPPSHARES